MYYCVRKSYSRTSRTVTVKSPLDLSHWALPFLLSTGWGRNNPSLYLGVLQSRKVSDTSKFTSEYSVSGSFIFITKSSQLEEDGFLPLICRYMSSEVTACLNTSSYSGAGLGSCSSSPRPPSGMSSSFQISLFLTCWEFAGPLGLSVFLGGPMLPGFAAEDFFAE